MNQHLFQVLAGVIQNEKLREAEVRRRTRQASHVAPKRRLWSERETSRPPRRKMLSRPDNSRPHKVRRPESA